MSLSVIRRAILSGKLTPEGLLDLPRVSGANVKKIIVGMSGGVDSSVAALIARSLGHEVQGVHMVNWDTSEEGSACTEREEWGDASGVGGALGMPVERLDLVNDYWVSVFEPFLDQYSKGLTPNPDVMCNRHIKFSALRDRIKERYGDVCIATGHYARLIHHEDAPAFPLSSLSHGEDVDISSIPTPPDSPLLAVGSDPAKDQAFFLSAVKGENLGNVWFPLGSLNKKEEVRKLAEMAGLSVAAKKDSSGICFIGPRDTPEFLKQYVKPTSVKAIDVTTGLVISHDVLNGSLMTVGQKPKISGLGGRYFVCSTDIPNGFIFLCKMESTDPKVHPALLASEIKAVDPHWITPSDHPGDDLSPKYSDNFTVTVRNLNQGTPCEIVAEESGSGLTCVLGEPLRAVAPGQNVVMYDGPLCIGSATITASSTLAPHVPPAGFEVEAKMGPKKPKKKKRKFFGKKSSSSKKKKDDKYQMSSEKDKKFGLLYRNQWESKENLSILEELASRATETTGDDKLVDAMMVSKCPPEKAKTSKETTKGNSH